MLLWITPAQSDAIVAHTEHESPREACGLIGGTIQNGVYRAVEIIPIANRADDPVHHFRMDDSALVKTLFGFEARGLVLVGIYHSHPQGKPIPSAEDAASGYYPGTPYLIVGRDHDSAVFAVWELRHRQVTPAILHIALDAPLPTDVPRAPSSVIPVAVIISAVLATIFMIALSLSLLPPAPDIVR